MRAVIRGPREGCRSSGGSDLGVRGEVVTWGVPGPSGHTLGTEAVPEGPWQKGRSADFSPGVVRAAATVKREGRRVSRERWFPKQGAGKGGVLRSNLHSRGSR